jgi:hypothetical protein
LSGEVSVDGRLALGVAAGWLRTRLLGLFDTEDVIEELVGVGCAGVLCDKQKNAPVCCLEDGQEPPVPIEA